LGSDRSTPEKAPAKRPAEAKVHHKNQDMGSALRSVYQRTIDEDIPAEMLDLLGKLG